MMEPKIELRFGQWLRERGLHWGERQQNAFARYYSMLVEWNQKMNLTAITDQNDVYVKHFYDSLSLSFYVDMHKIQSLADIGSGAGFPSIPLKIVYPHLQVTIVDSLQKRIRFLQQLVAELDLSAVDCVHARAEDAAREPQHRDTYDLVTARAVARMNVLNELCLPFVKPGGMFAAMKGGKAQAELTEAQTSLRMLQAKLEHVHTFVLPEAEAERNIIIVRKQKKTPARYPRKAGTPARNPIK